MAERRKVCVVVASRANYARIKTVLAAVRGAPRARAPGRRRRLARARALRQRRRRDGARRLRARRDVRFIIEGETPTTMAKSTGLGLLELPTVFELLQPDIVVTVADRFETIATAIAAAYMNIPVAHTQGGEVSGSIDESVRHAVTKLAHLHFPATELSAAARDRDGRGPAPVFNLGCPSIDLVAADRPRAARATRSRALRRRRLARSTPSEPFVLMMQHPVTTEYGAGPRRRSTRRSRRSRDRTCRRSSSGPTSTPARSRSPRASACSARRGRAHGFHFFRNLPPEIFVRLMAHCAVHGRQLVGGAARGRVPRHAGGHRRHPAAGPRARRERRRRRARRRTRSPTRSATRSSTAATSATTLFGDGTRGRADRRRPRRPAAADPEAAPPGLGARTRIGCRRPRASCRLTNQGFGFPLLRSLGYARLFDP